MNFMIDIETLDVESSAIVLTASIVYFEIGEEVTFQGLKDRAMFVKFDSREQAKLKRTVSKETLDWWMQHPKEVRDLSFNRTPNDLGGLAGINKIKEYIKTYGDDTNMIWQRGSLDQMCMESLCRTFHTPVLINHNRWCDIRTALRCLKETVDGTAYCTIPGFDKSNVKKHDPTDDICYDVMMLLYGD